MNHTAESGTKTRSCYWDNLKFLLILFVVIGHSIEPYLFGRGAQSLYSFLYSFHMPLFVFTAGVFSKSALADKNKLIGRVVSYVMIGFLCKLVMYILKEFSHSVQPFSLFAENSFPWFLFALGAYLPITYFLRPLRTSTAFVFSLVLACAAGLDPAINDKFVLSRILVFFPYFWLGQRIDPDVIERIGKSKANRLIGAAVFTGFAVIFFLKPDLIIFKSVFYGAYPYASLPSPLCDWGALSRILGYCIALAVGGAFLMIIPRIRLPIATEWGARTMQIYFWYPIALELLRLSQLAGKLDAQIKFGLANEYLLIGIGLTLLLGLKPFRFPTGLMLNNLTPHMSI